MKFFEDLKIFLDQVDLKKTKPGDVIDFFNGIKKLAQKLKDSKIDLTTLTKTDLEKYLHNISQLLIYCQVYDTRAQLYRNKKEAIIEEFIVQVRELSAHLTNQIAATASAAVEVVESKRATPAQIIKPISIPISASNWVNENKAYIPEVKNSRAKITIRIFKGDRDFSILGINTTGHISLEVTLPDGSSEYLSLVGTSNFDNLQSELRFLELGLGPRPFTKEVMRADPYTRYVELTIDCDTTDPVLDIKKVYDEVKKIKEAKRSYDFFNFNCSTAVNQALMAGNDENLYKKPLVITPYSVLNSCFDLAARSEKTKVNSVNEDSWQDLFEHLARNISLIDNQYLENYLKNKDYEITLPSRQEWFQLSRSTHFEDFLKHLQILCLGLSQKKDISDEDIKYFLEKTLLFMQRFSTEEQQILRDKINPILNKFTILNHIEKERTVLTDLVKFNFLREVNKTCPEYLSFLDTIYYFNEFSDREIDDLNASQYNAVKQFHPTIKHLNDVLEVVKLGLSSDINLHNQILTTKHAIQELYRLEAEPHVNRHDNPTRKKLDPTFYATNRNILRQHLGNLYASNYFADTTFTDKFRVLLKVEKHAPQSISSIINTAITNINSQNKTINEKPPSRWNLFRTAERSKILYDNACIRIANILKEEKSPYEKQAQIRAILNDNRPNFVFFWKKEDHKKYQDLAQKAELVLIVKAFIEGYIKEEDFYLNLQSYERKYPDAEKLSENFKQKYLHNIKENLIANPQETVRKMSARGQCIAKSISGPSSMFSPLYKRALEAAKEADTAAQNLTKPEAQMAFNPRTLFDRNVTIEKPHSRFRFSL